MAFQTEIDGALIYSQLSSQMQNLEVMTYAITGLMDQTVQVMKHVAHDDLNSI